jgi:hypothetical protein
MGVLRVMPVYVLARAVAWRKFPVMRAHACAHGGVWVTALVVALCDMNWRVEHGEGGLGASSSGKLQGCLRVSVVGPPGQRRTTHDCVTATQPCDCWELGLWLGLHLQPVKTPALFMLPYLVPKDVALLCCTHCARPLRSACWST